MSKSFEIDGNWYELPDYTPERITLTTALDIFSDHLGDIKEACQLNTLHVMRDNPQIEPSGDEALDWVRDGLRELRIKKETEHYQKTLKRIRSLLEHKRNPYQRGQITDAMIERAREYPIEDLYDGHLKGPESGRRFGLCPFHDESTSSFCIHKDNRWSCFGACSEHGDSIAYYMKLHGVAFPLAVKALQ